MEDKNKIEVVKLEKKKNISIWVKIFFGVSLLILIFSIGINNVNGASVVSDKPVDNKYSINCLGNDNIISLYSEDDTNKGQFNVIYSSKCRNTLQIYAPYIDKADKLNIVNGDNLDNNRINYIEYFNKIYDEKVNIKMDTFTDEFCFTIKLNKYADIKILQDTKQNVKDFYKCYPKKVLSSIKTSSSGSVVVPIFINNELKQEFVIKKPREKFKISFQDLGVISSELSDKMVIGIQNPSGVLTKVQVIDSNIDCHTKNFVISDKYNLFCNQSKDVNNYFIQLKDSQGDIFYGQYQRPNLSKKSKDVNWYLIGGILLIVLIIGLNIYKSKSKDKDKSAIQQLQERQNENE